ncbi:MAG: prepilin peptidase [Oscillospiraceae bacterium]
MNSILALMYILIFIFGITIGSFLNVCILRLPLGESIVTGPSHCPRCGRRLKWFELIPLFSFLALRGRCSGCKSAISPQYPLIEAVNGVLWVLVFAVLGITPLAALTCALGSALLVIAVIDGRTGEIPSGTTIFILVLGVIATVLDLEHWLSHLIGLFAVSLPLLLLLIATKGKGIGGGDIKLMAGAGLFLGGWQIALALFAACLIGTVTHIILMATKKAGSKLAFGPYLALALQATALWGNTLIAWYMGLLGL